MNVEATSVVFHLQLFCSLGPFFIPLTEMTCKLESACKTVADRGGKQPGVLKVERVAQLAWLRDTKAKFRLVSREMNLRAERTSPSDFWWQPRKNSRLNLSHLN
jgi:hypothetical protein